MATLKFSGVGTQSNIYNDPVDNYVNDATQTITVSGDNGAFGHDSSLPRPSTTIPNASEIGSPSPFYGPLFQFNDYVWGQSNEFTTTILTVSYFAGFSFDNNYYYEIKGDPLPDLPTREIFDAFLDNVTSITPSSTFDNVLAASATIITHDDVFLSSSFEDSTFFGGLGNDLFDSAQGGGADTYDGGEGTDIVRYLDQVWIDLQHAELSTNTAAADTYVSIEAIIGSRQYADNLRGDGEDNILLGDTNAAPGGESYRPDWLPQIEISGSSYYEDVSTMGDWLYGRAGDDILFGGARRDNLIGGLGADAFYGGTQFDTVIYSNYQPVVLDLANGALNTGEAVGDTFDSIERVIGTWFEDILRGDNGDMEFFGGAANDILRGGGGDDFLHGQDGRDLLAGGGDNDTLRGGQGSDSFIFNHGQDVIEDFTDNVDRLYLDGTHLDFGNGTIVDLAEVIDGNTVLDFGNGHTLTLLGISDPDVLLNDLVII